MEPNEEIALVLLLIVTIGSVALTLALSEALSALSSLAEALSFSFSESTLHKIGFKS